MYKWSGVASLVLVKSLHKLPPNQCSPGWADIEYFWDGHLVSRSTRDTPFTFLYVPPIASRKPIESWSIQPDSVVWRYTVYPPENLIAIVQAGIQWVTGVQMLSD